MSNHQNDQQDNLLDPSTKADAWESLNPSMKAEAFESLLRTIADISYEIPQKTLDRIAEYGRKNPLDTKERSAIFNGVVSKLLRKSEKNGDTKLHQYLTDLQERQKSGKV